MPDGDGPVALDTVLMTLVVELLYFLENTPPDELKPDTAQRMAGEVAFQLGRVEPHRLLPFVHFIRAQAESSAWPAERDFLQRLPGYLGWE